MGQYMQAAPTNAPAQRSKEADNTYRPQQIEPMRGLTPAAGSKVLPRPYLREPPPSIRSRPEERKETSKTSFRFRKTQSKGPAENVQPELEGRSSGNVLRKKRSLIAQLQGNFCPDSTRADSLSPTKWSQTAAETRPRIEASMRSAKTHREISANPRTQATAVVDSPPIIPELDRYRGGPAVLRSHGKTVVDLPPKTVAQNLPPRTPRLSETPVYYSGESSHRRHSGSLYSASPSTRFSGSPGPGIYSRETTPTSSMSSQSPSIIAPLKPTTPRLWQGSPARTRPPLTHVTRRRGGSKSYEVEIAATVGSHSLPSSGVSVTSSSSSSTANGEGHAKERKEGKNPSPLSSNPQSRTSSQTSKKPRSEDQRLPSKPSQAPAELVMSPGEPSLAKQRLAPSAVTRKQALPTRPSRAGASILEAPMGGLTTLVKSNLPGMNLAPEGEYSSLPRTAVVSPPLSQPAPRFKPSSRLPSRAPSPSFTQPSSREATPAPLRLGTVPDLRPLPPSSRVTASRTPSPSLANAKPRFGLFGRRTKTASELSTAEIKEKILRKGPVAGTGHEGYGRYVGTRSCRAGGLSRAQDRRMSGSSSSQVSVASTRAHDPFLLERMSPVVIAGGGEMIENRNASSELSRTESNMSLLLGRPSVDSSSSKLGHETTRFMPWPSALPRETSIRTSGSIISKSRRPSDSSDDGIGRSSFALRRSTLRMNNSTSIINLPKPMNITCVGRGMPPSIESLDTKITSGESQLEIGSQAGRKTYKVEIVKAKKLEKRPKSPRKWTFFHRSQSKKQDPQSAMQVTVANCGLKASAIPHYALLDSSDDQQEKEAWDPDDVLRDEDVISLSNEELDIIQFGNAQDNQRQMVDLHLVSPLGECARLNLFSSPEPMEATPELSQTNHHLDKETAPLCFSRLAQVGRIPKIISAGHAAMSPKSFSRPFARLSTVQPLPKLHIVDKDYVSLGPSPPKPLTSEPVHTDSKVSEGNPGSSYTSFDSKAESTDASHHDFLFAPRTNSQGTTIGSAGTSLADITAVIPKHGAKLEEDEVWDEYDDLVPNDDTVKEPISVSSSHSVPFQHKDWESRWNGKSSFQARESPTLTITPEIKKQEMESLEKCSIRTSSSVYNGDMSARLREALTTIPTPTTPMSFSEFISGYGDRNNSIPNESAQTDRRGSQNGFKSTSSSRLSRSLSELDAVAEHENSSPISQVNLRVGSITVSKWLTFGHVLFSPARDNLMQLHEPAKRHSILVIDGLGNGTLSTSCLNASSR